MVLATVDLPMPRAPEITRIRRFSGEADKHERPSRSTASRSGDVGIRPIYFHPCLRKGVEYGPGRDTLNRPTTTATEVTER